MSSRPPEDLANERPTGERITCIDPQPFEAHEHAALGPWSQYLRAELGRQQHELARSALHAFYRLKLNYETNQIYRRCMDAAEPELARQIRNGRLGAAMLERLSVWQGLCGA